MRRIRGIQKSVVGIAMMIGAVAMASSAPNAQAATITGAMSFYGIVTPNLAANGLGGEAPNWTSAKSLIFFLTYESLDPSGSFSSIEPGYEITMDPFPLDINPAILPPPTDPPLWTVKGFTFTLTSFSEPLITPSVMELTGTGDITDGNPADTNTGEWVATFTSLGETYGWSSSFETTGYSVPTAVPLPEAVWSGLATLSLIGLVGAVRARKRPA
jgi:hypothetical protein